jgi:hypothetical protein
MLWSSVASRKPVTSTAAASGIPSNLRMSGKLVDPIVSPTNAKNNSPLSGASWPVISYAHCRTIDASCVCVSVISSGAYDADLDGGTDTRPAAVGGFSGCNAAGSTSIFSRIVDEKNNSYFSRRPAPPHIQRVPAILS